MSYNKRIEWFGAWSAMYYIILVFAGWWPAAEFFPLHMPSAGADEIAQIYQEDHLRIRIGMVLIMWGAAFYIPFGAAIAQYVARVEGDTRILTYVVIMAAFANAMLTFYPAMWWAISAFRGASREAELIHMLNDAGWLQFLGGLSLAMPMYIALAITVFRDKSKNPVFPRWVGYYNLWVFVLLLPDQMLFFFYDGPFAWNGIIAIWIPLTIFTSWFFVMFYYMRKAALRPDTEAEPSNP